MVSNKNARQCFRQCTCGELFRGGQLKKHTKERPGHHAVCEFYACVKCVVLKKEREPLEGFHALHNKCGTPHNNFKKHKPLMRLVKPLLQTDEVLTPDFLQVLSKTKTETEKAVASITQPTPPVDIPLR